MKTILLLLKFVLPLILATCLLLITNPEVSLADGTAGVSTDNYSNGLPSGFFQPTGGPRLVVPLFPIGSLPYRRPGFTQEPYQQIVDKGQKDVQLEAILTRTKYTPDSNWLFSDGITPAESLTNSSDPKITVPTDKVGTFYYQYHVHTSHKSFMGKVINDNYYSKVAKVIVNEKHIDATSLTINNDTKYLFNEPTDFFQTSSQILNTKEPSNASGAIKWSISDPNLATIDQNGVLKANQNRNSGIVTVQARIDNENGKVIKSNPLDILIGGGLKNVTVKEGEKATFKIANTEAEARDEGGLKTEWYKVDSKGVVQKLPQSKDSNPFQYSFDANLKDDDSKYFVKVFATENNKTTLDLQTNQATLNVIPNKNIENLNINNEIKNNTYASHNNYDELFNVARNDTVFINSEIENKNSTDLTNSKLVLTLPPSLAVQEVDTKPSTLDSHKHPIDPSNYSISKDTNELTIRLGTINKESTEKVFVKSLMNEKGLQQSAFIRPYLKGMAEQSIFLKNGNPLKLNFSENLLHVAFKNIHFHPISQFQKGFIDTRTDDTNAPNAIMNVDDQRRSKNAQTISVKQISSFPNVGSLPFAQLMLKKKDGLIPINQLTEVANSEDDSPVTPIIWSKNEGLFLRVNTNTPPPGKYSVDLQWTITDSVQKSS